MALTHFRTERLSGVVLLVCNFLILKEKQVGERLPGRTGA